MLKLDIIFDNPIFMRELRRRMRGKALIYTTILYVAALCGIAYLIILRKAQMVNQSAYFSVISDIGQELYVLVITVQFFLVLFVAPTITSAMVRSEKERQTFDFLRATSISSPTYVVGALLSTVLYVLLALFCALPVVMLSYLYGGVSNIVSGMGTLLAISIVLSSMGLLISTITEKGRQNHGVLIFGLVFAGIMIIPSMIAMIVMKGTWIGSGSAYLFGLHIPEWVIIVAIAAAVSFLLLLIASRKLFNVLERAFSYRQFAILYILILGVIGVLLLSHGTAIGRRRLMGFQGTFFILLGVAMQNTMIVSRVDNGNERWRVKKLHPSLRNRDESLLYTISLTAVGAIILVACYFMAGASLDQYYSIVPAIVYLAANGMICKFLINRIEDEKRALKFAVFAEIAVLFLPSILQIFGSKALRSIIEVVKNISPLEAINSLYSNSGGAFSEISFSVAATGGLLVIAFILVKHSKPRHDVPGLNYELGL
jgi:hypothetical protein